MEKEICMVTVEEKADSKSESTLSNSRTSEMDRKKVKPVSSKEATIFEQTWLRFIPAIIVWPIWIFLVTKTNSFGSIFTNYWPASIAMVFGSFIAGSTPLGGGVVAFPLSVLVLKFTSIESRDASILVQSVGMNAAAFLLFVTKQRELLNAEFIVFNLVFGSLGMILGLSIDTPAKVINLIYTILVFEFAIIYYYKNEYQDHEGAPVGPPDADNTKKRDNDWFNYGTMFLCAFAGGFTTANVGSGSDIALYAHGVFIWNNNVKKERCLTDNELTASSVVVMGAMSFLTSVVRALTTPSISQRVLYTWGAMAFVVVLGAPIGSMVLKPEYVPYLRMLFYCLAVIQLVLFGALEIKASAIEWIVIGVITVLNLCSLGIYHYLRQKKKRRNERAHNMTNPVEIL